MSCPACFRALALVPLIWIGCAGTRAGAEQSEPAPQSKQADQKPVTQNAPQAPAPTGTPSPTQTPAIPPAPITPQPGTTINPAAAGQAAGPPQAQATPAQQRYGLPKNPPVGGGPVDTDLTRPLTLERAIRIGLLRQNAIAIAGSQALAAQQRLIEARSTYWPQITPSLNYVTSLRPGGTVVINGQQFGGASQSETLTNVVVAQQLIWDTGRREATVGANRRSAFSAEYSLGNSRQDVIVSIVTDYYNVLRDMELVRAEQENLRRAQATLESILAQIQVGNAARSDALQSQADLANAQVAVYQAQSNLNTDQAALKNAMGVVASQPLVLADTTVPTPNPNPDPRTVDDYVRIAFANRLDIKAEQERVYALGYNVRLAQINSGLSAEANITEGYQLNPDAGEERQFNVTISYPLFDAGNTRAIVRENKANLEAEKRTLDQLEQLVHLNIEQAYLIRELARQSVVASQAAVTAGQENYNAALEKQRNGLINIVDVITAEAQLITAQVNLIQAIYNFYVADASLQRNIGLNDPAYVPKVPGAKPVGLQPVATPARP